jgi:hypothetical protein
MSDIFVSYAREDEERAQELAHALEAEGWKVFWDRTIPPGKTWRDVIGAELEAARCVLVVWSEASVASEWVIEEADDGKERGILVPVLFDEVRAPLGFRHIQAASLTEWQSSAKDLEFRRLVTEISTKVKPRKGTERAAISSRDQSMTQAHPADQELPVAELDRLEPQAAEPNGPKKITRRKPQAISRVGTPIPAMLMIQALLCLILFCLTIFIDAIVFFSHDPVAWFGGRVNEAGSEFALPVTFACLLIGVGLIVVGQKFQDDTARLFGWISAVSTVVLSGTHSLAFLLTYYGDAYRISVPTSLVSIALLIDLGYAAIVFRTWWRAVSAPKTRK